MKTAIGVTVQVVMPTINGSSQVNAGIITNIKGGKNTEITIFPVSGELPYKISRVRHLDFKKDGEPYWRHPIDDV